MKSENIREFFELIGEQRLRDDSILRGDTNELNNQSVFELIALMMREHIDELYFYTENKQWKLTANGEFRNPDSPSLREGRIDDLKNSGDVFHGQNSNINPFYKGQTRSSYVDQYDVADDSASGIRETTRKEYRRSQKVKDTVGRRAKGYCEYCGEKGFTTYTGGIYLETHHIQFLSEDGKDTERNTIALCPEDHRKAHLSEHRDEIKEKLLAKIKEIYKEC